MTKSLRVALVTGTAGGMGAAVAERLSHTFGTVFGVDRPGVDQSATQEAVAIAGGTFVPLSVDITDETQVAGAYETVQASAGRLDVLAHLAGVGGHEPDLSVFPIESTPLPSWDRILRINLTGTFLMCRQAIPLIKQSPSGRLITTASQLARVASTSTGGAYPASKGAVIAFTRILALEVAPYGATANCLCPGLTDTPMAGRFDKVRYAESVPLRRLGASTDIAAAAAFYASEESGYITGTILDINGGKWMP